MPVFDAASYGKMILKLKMSTTVSNVLSDFVINLAAGWTAAAFILPMTTYKFKINVKLLMINITCAILCLMIAVILRS